MERQIRFLVENYYDIQKLRVEAFNRIVAHVESRKSFELREKHASLSSRENHSDVASQPLSESHEKGASHRTVETHEGDASRPKLENHYINAKPSILAHRIVALKVEPPKEISELVWYHNSLYETEKQLAKRLDAWSKHHRIRLNHLRRIRGIGPILSSGLIAWLEPISRFANISKLWAYCGLSSIHYECSCKKGHKFLSTSPYLKCPVKVGKKRVQCNAQVKAVKMDTPMKRKRGYLLMINLRAKTLMWKIATSFEKQNTKKSVYRKLYESQKKYYLNRADLKQRIAEKEKGIIGHIRNMTLRYVVKRFLSDLWVTWRRMDGLEITSPYIIDIGGHSKFEEPKVDSPREFEE